MADNLRYYGDTLDILRRYVQDETVDLVDLDPPFKRTQDYNVPVAEQGSSRSAAQLRVFEDPWRWNQAAAGAHQAIGEAGGKVAQAMPACEAFLGNRDVVWPGLFLEARP